MAAFDRKMPGTESGGMTRGRQDEKKYFAVNHSPVIERKAQENSNGK